MTSFHQRDLSIVVLSDAKCEIEVPMLTGIHNDRLNVRVPHAKGKIKVPVLSFILAQKIISSPTGEIPKKTVLDVGSSTFRKSHPGLPFRVQTFVPYLGVCWKCGCHSPNYFCTTYPVII